MLEWASEVCDRLGLERTSQDKVTALWRLLSLQLSGPVLELCSQQFLFVCSEMEACVVDSVSPEQQWNWAAGDPRHWR